MHNTINPLLQKALSQIIYPGFSLDILAMNLVHEATLNENGLAKVVLRPMSSAPQKLAHVEAAIKNALLAIAEVKQVDIAPLLAPKAAKPQASRISGVNKVLAIASCKGGVGKSTVAVNLAHALGAQGLKVGLLDLDIYGPSIPSMLGLENAKVNANEQGEFIPVTAAQGLKVLSLGFMTEKDQALSWRGPMLVKMMDQLFHRTAWQGLDVLVLDLPPGTGDVQMSLLRHIILDAVVIVSTSQTAAINDTRRGISMFKEAKAPIAGLVENMSSFICPSCGLRQYLFGKQAVEPLAQEIGYNYLGEIPLDAANQELTNCFMGQAAAPYNALAQKITIYLKG